MKLRKAVKPLIKMWYTSENVEKTELHSTFSEHPFMESWGDEGEACTKEKKGEIGGK